MRSSIWSRTNNKEIKEDTVEAAEDMVDREVTMLVEEIEEDVAVVEEEAGVAEDAVLESWKFKMARGDHYYGCP